MRLVLDTNVVISGLLWSGTPRRVFDLAEKEGLTLYTSDEMLEELADTLVKDKFRKRIEKLGVTPTSLVAQYRDACLHVLPVPIYTVLSSDRDEECVLECAVAAGADIIVSGDHHLLDLVAFQGIQILTPGEAVDHITNQRNAY